MPEYRIRFRYDRWNVWIVWGLMDVQFLCGNPTYSDAVKYAKQHALNRGNKKPIIIKE